MTIVLVNICSISVECRKDNVFCVIYQKGLKVNKSQIIHNSARFAERYFLFFWFRADASSLRGILCNSRQNCSIKILENWKKSLHVSFDRVQNVYA